MIEVTSLLFEYTTDTIFIIYKLEHIISIVMKKNDEKSYLNKKRKSKKLHIWDAKCCIYSANEIFSLPFFFFFSVRG